MPKSFAHGYSPRRCFSLATFCTPRLSAAVRMGIFRSFANACTWWKAFSINSSSFWFTWASSQKNCCMSCTHSKYDTVTARIAQHIRDDEDIGLIQDGIGVRRRWPVGRLGEDSAAQLAGDLFGDLAFKGCRH